MSGTPEEQPLEGALRERVRRLWRLYYKTTYRIGAFIVCSLVMALAFPTMRSYSYEYELGRPWRHEDVIAPYDFPILKPEAQVSEERDSLLRGSAPFYVIDSVDEVELRLTAHKLVHDFQPRMRYYAPRGTSIDTLAALTEEALSAPMLTVARAGVFEVRPNDNVDAQELMLIRANTVEPYRFENLYTLREAYSNITTEGIATLREYYGADSRWVRQMVEAMPVSEYVVPNVTPDEARTETARNERLESLALSSGKVLAGQQIVRTGDIVSERTALLLNSLSQATANGRVVNLSAPIFIGQLFIVLTLMFTVYLFLYFFRRDYFRQLHMVNLILIMMGFMVVITGVLAGFGFNISFAVPYAVLPIILRIFTDSRLAIYVNTITVIIISFFAFNSQLFVFLHVPAGLVACAALFHLNKRIQIFRTAIYLFLYYCSVYYFYTLWQQAETALNLKVLIMFVVNGMLFLLSYPLMYVVEKMFGFVSDVTLLELSDCNNDVLRQLSEKAPGTFLHSMQVANLGQDVAYKLGANAMLVRAGALYHDIGKLSNPVYYTENQIGGVNPHEKLGPEESARVIIGHVSEGVRLAKKYKVPEQIRRIIASHHGTQLTRYFYLTWCNSHPEEEPDLGTFRYPGPAPKTKEEAIVMMSDAVEAASKSLSEYSDSSIDDVVEKVISQQMSAGQYERAPITFGDIQEAKEVFKVKLKNIYHARIKYPEARQPRPSAE